MEGDAGPARSPGARRDAPVEQPTKEHLDVLSPDPSAPTAPRGTLGLANAARRPTPRTRAGRRLRRPRPLGRLHRALAVRAVARPSGDQGRPDPAAHHA